MAAKHNRFITARLRRCRDLLRRDRLDALIVSDPDNIRYLTGFSGMDSVLVLTERRRTLVTDSRFAEQARRECYRLPLLLRTQAMPDAVAAVLADNLKARRNRRIGIEDHHITIREQRSYRRAIGKPVVVTEGILAQLRQYKHADEIKMLSRSLRVAESAMQETLRWIKVGLTEHEVAAKLNYEMSRRGSTEPAFATIVAFGPHAAQPHAVPGNARLRKGQPLLVDWGATIDGYRSDLTRCYVIGKIPARFADAYRLLLDAQHAAIAAIMPGVKAQEVDRQARDVIGRTLPLYGHGTGHGLGLKVHELPVLSLQSKTILQEGMVLTVEPGVYLPGRFGIRIEDDVLVTARGKRVLSRLGKNLDAVAL